METQASPASLDTLVHPNEKVLGKILAVMGVIAWIAIVCGTVGVALIFILLGMLFYVIIMSGFISHMKGSGAITSKEQFPDLFDALEECCRKLNVPKVPTMILIHANGIFNALAVRFLRRHYIVLYSDIVDAMVDDPEAIKFYIGHELGHIKRNHLFWQQIMAPVSWLPLIGAAYSRSREKTCDRHGTFCCPSKEAAARGMAALAVGSTRYKTLNLKAYIGQLKEIGGFWMSYHEIVSDYPYLTKRIALIGNTDESRLPKRNPLAWILALFTPRLNMVSLVMVYLIVVVAVGVGGGMGKAKTMIEQAETYEQQQYEQAPQEQTPEYSAPDYQAPQEQVQPEQQPQD